MYAPDALDIIHFFFEEDLFVVSSEALESRTAVRKVMYRSMYGKPYKYAHAQSSSVGTAGGASLGADNFYGEDIAPFNPDAAPVRKPYVPPTDFSENSSLPFGKSLDAPLG